MIIYAPISVGELLDKIVILRVKFDRLTDEAKKENVKIELELLETLRLNLPNLPYPDIHQLINKLALVNTEIWDIEDDIRNKERKKEFDSDFVQLARSVYFKNDLRAEIKRELNKIYGSGITEEKSYEKYN